MIHIRSSFAIDFKAVVSGGLVRLHGLCIKCLIVRLIWPSGVSTGWSEGCR